MLTLRGISLVFFLMYVLRGQLRQQAATTRYSPMLNMKGLWSCSEKTIEISDRYDIMT